MYKELILKTTINLYAHYGIRGVSMAQVAGALRISKKTLYILFGSKEELLCDCLDYEKKRIVNILTTTEKDISNPVEKIVMITHNLLQYKLYFCPSFHKDIFRFKKAIKKMEIFHKKLAGKYQEYFEEGKEKGDFLPDNNYETIATIFVELLSQNDGNKRVLVTTFLRGLCTDNGITVFNNLTPESLKNRMYNYN